MRVEAPEGLEGVVAARTRLSGVDGDCGELILAGYAVDEIAPKAVFEEVVWLLWHGTPPEPGDTAGFARALAARRELAPQALDLVRTAAARGIGAMTALRMASDALSLDAPTDKEASLRLTASLPAVAAAYYRFTQGLEPVMPRADLGHAANYLWMLSGEEPAGARVRALNTYFNTVIDHGLNASTFAARVIYATGTDLISAVVGAIGALKGPLHGGAPGPALDMVFEIASPDRAEPYLRAKLERGERLMGFGHRIYRVRDPRADVLARAVEQLYASDEDRGLYELALHVEQTALRLLDEFKPGRSLRTNVEFYTALLLHGLGLTRDLFAPTFAISRVAGWIAHCTEQKAIGRLYRPQSVYIGDRKGQWSVT